MKKRIAMIKNYILSQTFYIVVDCFFCFLISAFIFFSSRNLTLFILSIMFFVIGIIVLLTWLVTYLKNWGVMPVGVKEYEKKRPKGFGKRDKVVVILLVLTILTGILSASIGGNINDNDGNVCGSCGRSYSAGDIGGNYMSIARTGMCKNCYNNFKWAQDALGN